MMPETASPAPCGPTKMPPAPAVEIGAPVEQAPPLQVPVKLVGVPPPSVTPEIVHPAQHARSESLTTPTVRVRGVEIANVLEVKFTRNAPHPNVPIAPAAFTGLGPP